MKHRANLQRWLAAGLTVLALACGDTESDGPPAPAPAAPPAEPAPPPAAEPAAEPAATAADAAAGAQTYALFCATCHGNTGDADTPIAKALDPPPVAHSNGSYMNALSDDYLFRVIKQGGAAVGKSPNMAPWGGSLSDQQIRNVIAHVRTLANPPYPAATP